MSETRAANGFTRQTLQQLIARAQVDIEANLPGSVARLPQTNLDALAHMAAGMADEQLEGIDYYALQIHITTASGWGLDRHGSEWGIIRREATRATGIIDIRIIGPATVPQGALFQTRDTRRYRVATTESGSTTGPGVHTLSLAAEAVTTGPEGNTAAGTPLQTVNPITGVQDALIAVPGFAGGNPAEDQESYRSRILDRIQEPPQGGAAYDYRAWMLQYPGCTRAWVSPLEQGLGTVVCRFAMDNTYPDGIPSAAEVARMAQWLDARRPVTAEVFVYAPIARPVDVTIRDLNYPNGATAPPPGNVPPPQLQNAVEDELRDMLFREGEPGAIIYRSWFWEAVSIASGERHHHIDVPADDFQLAIGEIATLGTITYTYTPIP